MRPAADVPLEELRERLADLTSHDAHRLGRRLERAVRKDDARARGEALTRWGQDVERARALIDRRRAAVPAVTYPPQLPVSARRDDLLEAVRDHQVVVVAGETGSGKTTQLPKICLELGRGVRGAIAHTQPRRLAARSVASRIADELGVELGGAVGYAVRFDERAGDETLVRLMTDGLLLAEIQHDRQLRRYDTIIVDEAHERSLNVDFLLGYLHRLLPRRPDLKLVVTSATIDPQRFSDHFGGAPIVEVSGRTYPVEVRYRPPPVETDEVDAVGDAVEELLGETGGGDVLVFLSGEREIRDTAEALGGRLGDRAEVLPLYARLSAAEQQRVFKPHRGRRVVLATNVAETSLTVPGIHYVVDPGTARISRYSARLKVQRLPIEPVSQAAADQRKGRCGRVAEGVCIRLYSEEDFEARPRFTEPEVQRTNLASVLLQMASLGLGDIEDFPFLDPPDRRQVRDGVALLHELGALEERTGSATRLTPVGRRLARLPVDPRLGRMVLEADRLSCTEEVIVLAAALSIQDPRERPADKRAHADQLHARFADEHSDFAAYLELFGYVRRQRRALSGSAFRRLCRDEFLNPLRVREWQDLVGQLRQAARELGLTLNQAPGDLQHVHVALLSGLLSHIGVRDAQRREYLGARGARFAIFPGSSLARRPPSWVVAAELVETSRLWGRTVARIDPRWVEPLAGHLVTRTHSEPRWDRKRGAVVATERVTLYGLPLVTGRVVAYGAIDPAVARDLFVRRALVERDWETRHRFFAENGRRLQEVEALEDRARRRDLRVGDDVLYDFFDARVPAEVVSAAHFDRWWKDARRRDPDLLTLPRDLLVADAEDLEGRPSTWRHDGRDLTLTYAFDPGAERDGVTAHVPLDALASVRPEDFDWLVPALRRELVTALIRGLPKDVRRRLVPVPEVVDAVIGRLVPGREPLPEALSREIEAVRGVRVEPGLWDLERLPAHLRMRFRVETPQGEAVAEGRDLEELRARARPQLRAELAATVPGLERSGLRAWEIGELPRRAGAGFPALVDEGETAGVRVLDSEAAQRDAMRAGTRRLLALTTRSPVRFVQDRLDLAAQVALAAGPGGAGALLADAAAAAIDALVDEAGGPAWDEAAFARLRDHVAGELVDRTAAVVADLVRILSAAREVEERLDELGAAPIPDVREDVARQLGRLLHPGFVVHAGAARLPDVERYLRAALHRLSRLPAGAGADRRQMAVVHELEAEHRARVDAVPAGQPLPGALREVPWLLQELRVSLFAQALGTRGTVSPKRIRRLLAGG